MKQKVVIKISTNGRKSHSKAMKIAVGVQGVESAALQGQDKNLLEVTGDGIDAATLTTLLRKNLGFADLVSVSPVGDKKNEAPTAPTVQTNSLVSYPYPHQIVYPYGHQIVPIMDNHHDPCSIM